MAAFDPLRPAALGTEATALRETILESRAATLELTGVLAADGTLGGPFGPLLHTPAIGQVVQELGTVLRTGGELEAGLCEAVILTVVRIWDCRFEWDAHRTVALARGLLTEDDVEWLAAGETPIDPRIALACRFAAQQVREHACDADLRAAALAELGERGVVELTVLVAYYEMVCRLIATCGPQPMTEEH